MAEGGRGENDDSFKGKLFSCENRQISNDEDDEDEEEGVRDVVFCEPDLGMPPPLTRERDRLNDEDKGSPSRDENPFSFRHFLNADQMSTSDIQVGRTRSNGNLAATSRHTIGVAHNDRFGKPPRVGLEFASGLPDFVQDHLIQDNYSALHDNVNDAEQVVVGPQESHNSGIYHQEAPSAKFPDFAPAKSSPVNNPSSVSAREVFASGPSCKPKVSRKSHGVSHKSDPGTSSTNSSGSLPDFLSDGPMLNSHADLTSTATRQPESQRHRVRTKINNDGAPHDAYCEIMHPADVFSLIEDRNDLRRKLEETHQLLATESNMVCELRKEVELLRLKEVDEAVALEEIAQQVEAKLQSTTQRAVNSETVISKLRQEVKNLHSEVSRLRAENLALRCGDNAVIKRSKKASQQISEAADAAEQRLRQMLSGLESLRLISAVLADVDRIGEDCSGNLASGDI